MTRIVTVGEAMLELRPEADDFGLSVAGDAFNTAARLAATGRTVRHVQDIGADALAAHLRDHSRRRGVELAGREHEARVNGIYLVSVDADGERRFDYHRAGSAAGETLLGPEVGAAAVLNDADVVYTTGVMLALSRDPELLLDRIRRSGARLALGLNIRDGLYRRAADDTLRPVRPPEIAELLRLAVPDAEVVFGSVAELELLGDGASAAEVAAELAGARPGQAVVATDGERGASAWQHDVLRSAAPPAAICAVDTSGAGDAFAAGFLYARLADADLAACLQAGVAAGAAAVQHPGALPPVSAR